MIHVCPLRHIDGLVARTGARRLVSLLTEGTPMVRPKSIAEADHLPLFMHDVDAPGEGFSPPAMHHIETLLAFAERWDRSGPLVVHCFAGISRSTAAAYIVAAALRPERDEAELARTLRLAAPSATPNRLLVALADERLGRGGRMSAAIAAIGRGADAFEGRPFSIAVGDSLERFPIKWNHLIDKESLQIQ